MGAGVKPGGSPQTLKPPGPYFSLEYRTTLPNRTMATLQPPPAILPLPGTPKPNTPFSSSRTPPEHHPGEHP